LVAKKKKVRHRKAKEENPTYVKVENALTLRRELLGTAIDVTTLLKRWEGYKMIREMKLREIKALHSLMSEIEKEFRKFKNTLPKIKIEEEVTEDISREERKIPLRERGLSAIDQEIQEIKDKLAQIDL
jgi:hypothetical protein